MKNKTVFTLFLLVMHMECLRWSFRRFRIRSNIPVKRRLAVGTPGIVEKLLFEKVERRLGRFLWWVKEEITYCGRNETVISSFHVKNLHAIKNPDIFYVTFVRGGIYSNNLTIRLSSSWDRGFQYRCQIFGYY